MSQNNNISNFTFSMNLASEAKRDLSNKVDTLNDRIDNISNKVIINDMPVVTAILNITRSKNDLKKLAKALDRIADIVEVLDSLKEKLTVIKVAEKNPNWFMSAFGDFSTDIDKTIESILGEQQ